MCEVDRSITSMTGTRVTSKQEKVETSDSTLILDTISRLLQEIINWKDAYPEESFPLVNLPEARVILQERGIALSDIIAGSKRQVVQRCAEIAESAMRLLDKLDV